MGEEKEKPKEKEKDPKKEDKKEDPKEKKKEEKKDDKKDEKKEDKKAEEKDPDKEPPKEVKPHDEKDPDPPKNSKQVTANSAPPTISADQIPRQGGRRKGDQKLKAGSVVKTELNGFKIEKLLGSGAFGHVYKVHSIDSDIDMYAMKTEWVDMERKDRMSHLKTELHVLEDANSEINRNKECFVKLIDKGRTALFRFYVMELVSHTLEEILTVMCKKEMPNTSAAFLMRGAYIAIDALHQFGYIHRDIKPHNFAIGLAPFEKRVYILGFGIARLYWADEDRKLRPPRKSVKFLGTLKYCSRSNHAEKEQGRKDDYESWAYMCLEFFHEKNITWDREVSRDEIFTQKKKLFSTLDKSDLRTPSSFLKILKEIDKMTYSSELPKRFPDLIADVWKETKTYEKSLLIWETEAMPVSKPRKKGAKNRVQNDEDSDERKQREDKAKRREILAKKKRVEDELMRMMREMEGEASKESKNKKAEARPHHHDKKRGSDQRKRPSGGRKRRTRDEETDDYDDHDDYEDDEEDSYEEDRPRRRESHKHYRDEDRIRKKDTRKERKRGSRATTERTYDDQRDQRRKRSRNEEGRNDRRKTSKKNSKNSKRRTQRARTARTIDQEEKLMKIEDSPDGRAKVRKRSSMEKEKASVEKNDEMDGDKKASGQRGTKATTEGSKGPTVSGNVSGNQNDSPDKGKKK